MNKNYLIFGLCIVLLISFVSAEQQSLGVFKQNECVNLIQICADCSYVNFTSVTSPNSNIVLANVLTQQQGTQFNYTFCDTNLTGNYIVNGIGDPSSTATIFSYDFKITNTGLEATNYNAILICALILIPMLLALVLIIGGFVLDDEHNPLRIFLFLLSIILFFVSLNIGVVGINTVYSIPILEDLLGSTVYWVGVVLFAILSYFAIWMLYKVFMGHKEDVRY